jgi:hypothetical protein
MGRRIGRSARAVVRVDRARRSPKAIAAAPHENHRFSSPTFGGGPKVRVPKLVARTKRTKRETGHTETLGVPGQSSFTSNTAG